MPIEDRFYPWTEEDYHKQVFQEGEPVLVRRENYPFGKGDFSVHEGIVRHVNSIKGTDRFWYHVTTSHSGGDIPLRDLRPFLNDEELRERLRKDLEKTYMSLQQRVDEFDRSKVCKYLVLLDRIKQELQLTK